MFLRVAFNKEQNEVCVAKPQKGKMIYIWVVIIKAVGVVKLTFLQSAINFSCSPNSTMTVTFPNKAGAIDEDLVLSCGKGGGRVTILYDEMDGE